jgi:hypothetical protein
MSDWRKTYWQGFNIAGRLVGTGFVIVGGICFLYAISQGDVLAMVMTAVVAVLGILLIFAKPYRPDLSKSASSEQADDQRRIE